MRALALLLLLSVAQAKAPDYGRETRPADVLAAVHALSIKLDLLIEKTAEVKAALTVRSEAERRFFEGEWPRVKYQAAALGETMAKLQKTTTDQISKLDARLRLIEDDRNIWRGGLLLLGLFVGWLGIRIRVQTKDG